MPDATYDDVQAAPRTPRTPGGVGGVSVFPTVPKTPQPEVEDQEENLYEVVKGCMCNISCYFTFWLMTRFAIRPLELPVVANCHKMIVLY